jgi:hypothetical protein
MIDYFKEEFMYNIPKEIKDYIYIDQRLLDNIISQMPKNIFKLLEYKIGIKLKAFEATIENKPKENNDIEKIKLVYNYLEKNNFLRKPGDDLFYIPYDYYCIEKQNFIKVSLKHSKIDTKYDINKINFYISVDRTFSTIGNNSPLFLLPDNLNNNIGMDGSSGYSIFKLLMEDYLKCNECFLKQINENMKNDFAKAPIKFFNELGCNISDERHFETIYKKRSILKDYEHNIIYTFAYPIYIASST